MTFLFLVYLLFVKLVRGEAMYENFFAKPVHIVLIILGTGAIDWIAIISLFNKR